MRVLFLTHRVPFPPDRGDRIRAYQILRRLAATGEIEVVSLVHDTAEERQIDSLRQQFNVHVTGLRVPSLRNRVAAAVALTGSRPLTHVLLNAPGVVPTLARIVDERPPDIVLAYCSGMAQFALRPPLEGLPLAIDLVDLDSAKWSALATSARIPMRWIYSRESRLLGAFERRAIMRAGIALVVNEREADAARELVHGGRVQVVPNGVDLDALHPSSAPVESPRVVFCGVMNYEPNIDGVSWFAREVWPQVRKAFPSATFTIVGADPTDAVRRLADGRLGIQVTGRVPHVVPYLWESAVSVAPLRVARGVQNKVLEAIAAGLPPVVTTDVFEGLPNEVRGACRVADTSNEFARQTIRLLRMSGVDRRALANRADCAAVSWERQMSLLPRILREVISPDRPAGSPVHPAASPQHEWSLEHEV